MPKSALAASMTLDHRQMDAALRMLKGIEGGVPKAGERAVNRTLATAKKAEAKAIATEYTITVTRARKSLVLSRALAKTGKLWGRVTARGRRIPLAEFAHKPRTAHPELLRKPRGGVSVNVLRRTGYLKIQGAFKQYGIKTGKPHIMWRVVKGGKQVARYPARILYGPDPGSMAEKVIPGIQNDLQRRFRKRFNHEVRQVLRRWQQKARV